MPASARQPGDLQTRYVHDDAKFQHGTVTDSTICGSFTLHITLCNTLCMLCQQQLAHVLRRLCRRLLQKMFCPGKSSKWQLRLALRSYSRIKKLWQQSSSPVVKDTGSGLQWRNKTGDWPAMLQVSALYIHGWASHQVKVELEYKRQLKYHKHFPAV